jgi:hypothetical protein
MDGTSTPMSRTLRIAALAGAALLSAAHIGSPDTIFEGQAGPYPIRVVVRTPGVVPGLADIVIRVTGGPGGLRHVTVLPLRGGLPTAAEPPPDTARPVAGNPNLLSAQLWLMRFGAYSVQVTATGDAGSGSAIVPVNAVATRRLGMDRPMAIVLIGLGLFLFAGAVTIVAAAVRESVLPPGHIPDGARRRRAWVVAFVSVLLFGTALYGGKRWWDGEDAAFRRRIYRPPAVTTAVLERNGGRTLRFTIADSARLRREWSPLIPDHGKLMHLFLVSVAEVPAMAHLHPRSVDSLVFEAALPPLPAGAYHAYADIVHESGFSQTLADTIELAAAPQARWTPSDADDAWQAVRDSGSTTVGLPGGGTMHWERPPALSAGAEQTLLFRVSGPSLEPYMGMAGHAVIARDDGSVFVHLHPLGTIAAAAQLVYQLREPGDTVRGRLGRRITERAGDPHIAHTVGEAISFPYAFPRAGRYRIWVQVKSAGRVLTGAFTADVT